MEAIDFIKTMFRLCKSNESCHTCPLNNTDIYCGVYETQTKTSAMERSVSIVEKWGQEHPVKTKAGLFLERNPDCKHSVQYPDIPDIRPCDYDESINFPARCCRFNDCQECRKDYWKEPVE